MRSKMPTEVVTLDAASASAPFTAAEGGRASLLLSSRWRLLPLLLLPAPRCCSEDLGASLERGGSAKRTGSTEREASAGRGGSVGRDDSVERLCSFGLADCSGGFTTSRRLGPLEQVPSHTARDDSAGGAGSECGLLGSSERQGSAACGCSSGHEDGLDGSEG